MMGGVMGSSWHTMHFCKPSRGSSSDFFGRLLLMFFVCFAANSLETSLFAEVLAPFLLALGADRANRSPFLQVGA